ncbi:MULTISPECIES: helix-turn-helix domain-containing protein [unclassified Streptomyces]|uniref:helix-turn-helix domain-containing protein n=1 Tax=unclassified Streptomyces TaxID=2593676 RepID=UPI0033E26886
MTDRDRHSCRLPPPPANHEPRKIQPGQIDELRDRHAAGENVRDLALAYQVSVHTIRRYLPG